MNYKQAFANLLSPLLPGQPADAIQQAIAVPPDAAMGHYAYPCHRLAKEMRKAPNAIAAELAQSLRDAKAPWLEDAQAAGPYVNIFLNRALYAENVLAELSAAGESYGRSALGAGRPVLVEFSSPNIAKHFHVGHLGSTVIGGALANIMEAAGYTVTRLNHLGDWGTQFGKLITAFLKWGDRAEVEARGIDELTRLYVRFHEEADRDGTLNDEARSWVVRMQEGDAEGLALWRWFCDLSMKEFERLYNRLHIRFDLIRGESYYNDKMEAIARELADKNLLTLSEGAQIVDLESYGMPPCLILRSDGGTLYPTRDIAAALDRYQQFHFYKCLIVTASEQNLHFAQWIKVVEMMGYPWAGDIVHIPYGLFRFEAGRMSSRRGDVIPLEPLFDEAVAKTLDIIREKNPSLPGKEKVAEQVGVGAVIFNEMYNSRVKDVVFSWERMLNFEGETGPYVQYAHTRACGVLSNAQCPAPDSPPSASAAALTIDGGQLADMESFEVLRLLEAFPERVLEAAEKYEPFIVSRFLVALAQAFNRFYHAHTVLTDDAAARTARLALTKAVARTLRAGLGLLGIEAPERM